jgi:serine protease Do
VLVTGGSRLGISVRDVEEADVKTGQLASTAGAVVDDVSEGSAAEKAGLRKGDIIVEFDGERVRSARQLTRLVQETPDGRKAATIVIRDGQRVTLTVEPRQDGTDVFERLRGLADWQRDFRFDVPARPVTPVPPPTPRVRPSPPSAWRMDDLFGRGSSGRLGLTVDTLSPQLAEYFGTKEGVLVTSVRDDSPAAKAGIKAGDVITSVNGSAIDDTAELRRRLQAVDEGEEFTITVMRDRKPQTLKGKLEQTVRRRTYRAVI